METSDKGKTFRLRIEHSIKQKEYVEWLYNQFKSWVNGGIRVWTRTSKFPDGSTKNSQKCGFTTYSLDFLRFYGQQFYSNGIKIIPKMIEKLLTPTSIAIWFLDDGSFKSQKHRTFIIDSHGFTKNELKITQRCFTRFGIKTKLHKQTREKGIYWRIYVLSESAEKFAEMVKPIINQIPSMKYKLGNTLPKE